MKNQRIFDQNYESFQSFPKISYYLIDARDMHKSVTFFFFKYSSVHGLKQRQMYYQLAKHDRLSPRHSV